ncbi:15244_t:CDS:1 [Cetraspora pellucida]|uniref:15244_t:CDS:1 n=1 Tax=Cetraspora pellucida TaxID=1433469 RepID=A0ACA9P132_9GLOM|nr:15244_t:CDS:1 [Cetraspora pellucida]
MEEYQNELAKLIIAINNYKFNTDTKFYYKKTKEHFKFFFDYTDEKPNNNNEVIIMLNSKNNSKNTNNIDKNDYNLENFSKDISNLSYTGSVIEIIAKKSLNMFITNFINSNTNHALNDMLMKSRRLTIIIQHEKNININGFAKMDKIITFFKYDKQALKEKKNTNKSNKSNDEKEYNTIINSMSKLKIDSHKIIGLKTTKLLESKFIDITNIINDYDNNKHNLITELGKFYNFTLEELGLSIENNHIKNNIEINTNNNNNNKNINYKFIDESHMTLETNINEVDVHMEEEQNIKVEDI